MSRHLSNLGNQFSAPLQPDNEGYLGRECPEKKCERYFKIKRGTGLKGKDLPCHCPYCGHVGPMNHFHTKDQIEYAKSLALKKFKEAVSLDLKDMADDFNRKMGNGFISMKMEVKSSSLRSYDYIEKELETKIECKSCALQYSVYGVFAFCPDCGQHNSDQILEINFDVTLKMLTLSEAADKDLRERLVENALEDCISSFDGFGRQLCSLHLEKAQLPNKVGKISFQNLEGAKANILDVFGLDISNSVTAAEWKSLILNFQKRHLIVHKMGVVDQEYVDKTGDLTAIIGHRVVITSEDVKTAIQAIRKLAKDFAYQLEANNNSGRS